MSLAPTVSVVIPTYNRSALLLQALDSVFAQSFRDYEVIVVNDGSTDDTVNVLRQLGDRVRCIHQRNGGLNAARNAGLAIARGEYVALLDDDDLWEPYKLELMLRLLTAFPRASFAFSNFSILRGGEIVERDGLRTWHPSVSDWASLFPAAQTIDVRELGVTGELPHIRVNVFEGDIYAPSLHGPWVLPATALVRRALVPEALEFPESDSSCGDWEYFARLSRHGGALFADISTAINRSHEDATRLTRLPQSMQLSRRIAMIERLWRADLEFMRANGAGVNVTLRDCLLTLARTELFAGNSAAARTALANAAELKLRPKLLQWVTLWVVSTLPGAGALLRGARVLRRQLNR